MDHLVTIIRTLFNHRIKLMVMPLLVMGLLYYLTANTPNKYKTEARLFLNLQEGKGVSLSDEDLKQYQVHTYFQNTIELLKAKRNAELVQLKVIEKALAGETVFARGNEKLIANKEAILKRLGELYEQKGFPSGKAFPDSLMTSFLGYHHLNTDNLRQLISAFRVMDSNFIKVELTDISAERAKVLADLFIESLMEENRTLAKNKVKGHKDIIEGLVRQAKADLDAKIKRLENYKVANNIINLGEHTKAIVVYLVELEGQRANLQAKSQAAFTGKEEVIKTVRDGNELALDLSTQKELLVLKDQLRAMNRQLLQESFDNRQSPKMEAISSNIEMVKTQIQSKIQELARKTPYDPSRVQLDLVGKFLSYDLEAETSLDMAKVINTEIQRVTRYSSRFAPFESTIGAYEQEISTAQHAYLVLLNKLNLTQTIEYGSGENVLEVIDPPYQPSSAEPSKRGVLIIAGGLAMEVLMAGFLIVVQLMDATVNSVEKFERASSLKVVAAVPQAKAKMGEQLRGSLELIRNQQFTKVMQLSGATRSSSPSLLLITSSQAGEGAQELSREIFTRLQGKGVKVAAIDADWMNAEAVEGFVSFKSLLENHSIYKNQNELSARLQELRLQNDVVVILSAPLNLTTDHPYWLSLPVSVIHTFKANRLFSKVDKRTESVFQNLGQAFLGVVLMNTEIENMEDYLGEIPRERSGIRKWIKKLITRNF